MKKRKYHKHTYTYEELKLVIEKLIKDNNGYGTHKLFDNDFEGACPCSHGYLIVDKQKYLIDTHCWRGNNGRCSLFVKGEKGNKQKSAITKLLKRGLDAQDWYGEYEIREYVY